MRKEEFPIVDEYCRRAKIEELEKIKAKIELMDFDFGDYYDNTDIIIEMVSKVINNHIKELKGE